MHVYSVTAASMIIPISTTPPIAPPTPPPTVPQMSAFPESVPAVNLKQTLWVVESTSIGQLGYTAVLLPWTRIDV